MMRKVEQLNERVKDDDEGDGDYDEMSSTNPGPSISFCYSVGFSIKIFITSKKYKLPQLLRRLEMQWNAITTQIIKLRPGRLY